jgi:hypothetical protein
MSDGALPCLHLPKKSLTLFDGPPSETLKSFWKINVGILGSKFGNGAGGANRRFQ